MCQIFIINHFYRETWITMNSQFFSVGVYCYVVIIASCAVEAGTTLPIKFLAESEDRNLTNEGIGTSQTDTKSDLNSESSSKILFYSEWSPWSGCLDSCERTRQRRCQNEEKCGNIELKETSVCDNPQSKRSKRKCHRTHNRRKHRHKNHEFRVVQLNPRTNPQLPNPNQQRQSQKSHSNHQVSPKDKLSTSTKQQGQHRQSAGITSPEGSWYPREPRIEQSKTQGQHRQSVGITLPEGSWYPREQRLEQSKTQGQHRQSVGITSPEGSWYSREPRLEQSKTHGQHRQSVGITSPEGSWYPREPRLEQNKTQGQHRQSVGITSPEGSWYPRESRLEHNKTQGQHRQSVGITSPEGSWYPREPRIEQSKTSSSSDVPSPQKESPVIFQNADGKILNRDRHAHKYVSKLYGKWSRWSQCTRSCTTHRRRLCKRRSICGADVIREAAYCYDVEGNYCHRWIQRKIQKNEEENEAAQDPYTAVYQSATSSKGRGMTYHSPIPQEHPAAGECGVAGNTSSRSSLGNMLRIIGGRPTSRGRWPWQVAVLNRFREAFCGGTLVSPRWVLTAAHCVRKRLYVRLGEHDLSEKDGTELEFRIDHVVQHPSYDAETVDNDVALLRLPLAVHPDRYHGLACLPRARQALPTSQYCTIIGWGKRVSSDMFGTDVLHEAEVPIVSNDVCRRVYQDYHITGNMFCAGYRRGRMDSCAGDSGGPLLCREGDKWTVFGITSFGEGCGKRGKYGIYTRLSNYIKWIQRTIKEGE